MLLPQQKRRVRHERDKSFERRGIFSSQSSIKRFRDSHVAIQDYVAQVHRRRVKERTPQKLFLVQADESHLPSFTRMSREQHSAQQRNPPMQEKRQTRWLWFEATVCCKHGR